MFSYIQRKVRKSWLASPHKIYIFDIVFWQVSVFPEDIWWVFCLWQLCGLEWILFTKIYLLSKGPRGPAQSPCPINIAQRNFFKYCQKTRPNNCTPFFYYQNIHFRVRLPEIWHQILHGIGRIPNFTEILRILFYHFVSWFLIHEIFKRTQESNTYILVNVEFLDDLLHT